MQTKKFVSIPERIQCEGKGQINVDLYGSIRYNTNSSTKSLSGGGIMNIAILTGATGGIGAAFVEYLAKENFDQIWCIARNQKKLDALKQKYGQVIRTFSMDLSLEQSILDLQAVLQEEQPTVKMLINNAGIAIIGRFDDFDLATTRTYIDLNVKSVVLLTEVVMPFMDSGSHIINMSSQSSFQPLPFINLYASGKAFIRSYSRSLNQELKGTGISVTACCPGWIDTPMLPKEYNGVQIKYPGLSQPEEVAKKALKDAKKGKDMSVYSLYVKAQHLAAKLLPQKVVMKYWLFINRKIVQTKKK